MKILVTVPMDDKERAIIEAAAPKAEFTYAAANEVTADMMADKEIIFGNVNAELLQCAKELKLMQLFTAGTDGYIGKLPEGCAITNTTGAFGLAISEHMLAMLLCLMKRMHQYRDNQRKHEWKDMGSVKSIAGSTAVILGLGDIGGEFARKLKLLGAYTIGVRRTDAHKPDYIDELVLTGNVDSVLPRADIIGMALPNTPQTVNMLNAERIAMLKEGCIVINVGRGSVIDEAALAKAIAERRILAGLDVAAHEPLDKDSPLWGLENCLITPHVSGFFHLAETKRRMIEIAAENIRRHIDGRPYMNAIDPSTGYIADKYGDRLRF